MHENKINLSVQVFSYQLKEYLGLYDMGGMASRLIQLQNGAKLFNKSGASYYEFQHFHQRKHLWYKLSSVFIYMAFGLSAAVAGLAGAPFAIVLLPIMGGFLAERMLISGAIRKNIVNSNKLLSGEQGKDLVKELMQIDPLNSLEISRFWEDFSWGQNIDSGPAASKRQVPLKENKSATSFSLKLANIAAQENQFNGMPMTEVIRYFNILCCDPCRTEVPQLSEADFILFLESGFLGKRAEGKLSFSNRKVMMTYQIFHQFYITAYNQFYISKDGNFDKYIHLLTDHFEGFDPDKVKNNFRTNDDKQLVRIRNQYKPYLQNIQPVQSRLID